MSGIPPVARLLVGAKLRLAQPEYPLEPGGTRPLLSRGAPPWFRRLTASLSGCAAKNAWARPVPGLLPAGGSPAEMEGDSQKDGNG